MGPHGGIQAHEGVLAPKGRRAPRPPQALGFGLRCGVRGFLRIRPNARASLEWWAEAGRRHLQQVLTGVDIFREPLSKDSISHSTSDQFGLERLGLHLVIADVGENEPPFLFRRRCTMRPGLHPGYGTQSPLPGVHAYQLQELGTPSEASPSGSWNSLRSSGPEGSFRSCRRPSPPVRRRSVIRAECQAQVLGVEVLGLQPVLHRPFHPGQHRAGLAEAEGAPILGVKLPGFDLE